MCESSIINDEPFRIEDSAISAHSTMADDNCLPKYARYLSASNLRAWCQGNTLYIFLSK